MICMGELLGYPTEMRRIPVIASGKPVRQGDKVRMIFDIMSEAKAFDRWQREKFYELERDFASRWRAQLMAAKHADMAKLVKAALKISDSPKTINDALAIAKKFFKEAASVSQR